jgi:hypothetical protein
VASEASAAAEAVVAQFAAAYLCYLLASDSIIIKIQRF